MNETDGHSWFANKTATLPNKFNPPNKLDSERMSKINSSAMLKPGTKQNRSVENTPASHIKESASGTALPMYDNISRKERSLSAFTDESFEPCGFMDYYKAYKKENDIPPSELGDNEGSASLKPPIFGLGLSRRNTMEANLHSMGNSAVQKPKGIDAISEQNEEVCSLDF